jgi:4-hydroxy-3-methylbut-2-en-1-yl diphosphate synthase IspG/GcpE
MDIQNIITGLIVVVAVIYILRSVIRPFMTKRTACPSCSRCGSETADRPTLIQIETEDYKERP